jgi:hypothetical protein
MSRQSLILLKIAPKKFYIVRSVCFPLLSRLDKLECLILELFSGHSNIWSYSYSLWCRTPEVNVIKLFTHVSYEFS